MSGEGVAQVLLPLHHFHKSGSDVAMCEMRTTHDNNSDNPHVHRPGPGGARALLLAPPRIFAAFTPTLRACCGVTPSSFAA